MLEHVGSRQCQALLARYSNHSGWINSTLHWEQKLPSLNFTTVLTTTQAHHGPNSGFNDPFEPIRSAKTDSQESEYAGEENGEPSRVTIAIGGVTAKFQTEVEGLGLVRSELAYYVAAEMGDLKAMHKLLASGHISINRVLERGTYRTALAAAYAKGHINIVRLLVDRRAQIVGIRWNISN